jgi:CHAT domain-containing protein
VSIDDESTSFLMSTFYAEYRRIGRKALALRRAQLRTLAKYPAPFYWAAFVLVGEN